ncbi:hypothetical protein [Thalassobellus suaedae]|nr:hypothetical protein RHP51_09515 [Flavobacteriaceae bacterium HL-DH14]
MTIKEVKRFLICGLLFSAFFGCSPTLNITDLEKRINKHYTASSEGDIEYFLKNTPTKFVKEYGEDGVKKKLHQMYDNREYPELYNSIGELSVQDRSKCNSTYYYKVKYIIDRIQHTPYLDSTALKLNQEKYGFEHVHFNPKLKTLQVRENKETILLFDKKAKEWIFLDYDSDMTYLNRYFGHGFSDCLQTKIQSSTYINY